MASSKIFSLGFWLSSAELVGCGPVGLPVLLVAFLLVIPDIGLGQSTELQFIDINPDESGAIAPGCPAPCLSGGSAGRIHHLASSAGNSQSVYAASELGGLFKSPDRGQSWSHIDGHLPTKSWDIAVDPAGSIVYATSFYDGRISSLAGIEVSNDAGGSWSRPASVVPPAGFCSDLRLAEPSGFGISIRPGAPNEVLVGTNCGLARSTDYGATWTYINPAPGGGKARTIWDVVALAGGLTYACGQDGIMKSPDGQTGWVQLPSPSDSGGSYQGYCSIAAHSDFPDALFVVFSRTTYFDPIVDIRETGYFFSLNGGQTWTAIPHPDAPYQKRVPMVAVNRRDYGLDVWLGAGNLYRAPCIFKRSLDGCKVDDTSTWSETFTDGNSETNKVHGDTGDLLFDPISTIDACPVLYSSDGGVYRNNLNTSPACQTPEFTSANTGLHAELLFGMAGARRSSSVDLYQTLQDIGFFATTDAQVLKPSWVHEAGADFSDVVADSSQVIVNPETKLIQAAPGYINPMDVPNTPQLVRGFPFFWVFTDVISQFAQNSYALVTKGADVVYTTTLNTQSVINKAVSWKSLAWPAGASTPCAVQASHTTGKKRLVREFLVLAGTCLWRDRNELWSLRLSKLNKAGTWKRLDVNTECPGGVGIASVDPSNPDRLYASCTGVDSTPMIRSVDGGKTWSKDLQLTNLMTGPNVFATRYGTPDDGITFGGVQPVMVAFDPSDKNLLIAGGYDSGLFISGNGGQGWVLLSDPYSPATSGVPHLPRPFFSYFDHEPGKPLQAIYIGTAGRGVWRVAPPRIDLKLKLKLTKLQCRFGCKPVPCPNCGVDPQDKLKYVIKLSNPGPVLARNVLFQQLLPAGLAFQSLRAPQGWECQTPALQSNGQIQCTASSFAAGSAARFEIQALVKARRGILRSEASVISNGIDPKPANSQIRKMNRINSRG